MNNGKAFSNKRRHRRFTVDVMRIEGSAVFASEVIIHDISITGASLLTEQKLETGREYSLRIMDGHLDFTISGAVVWSGESTDACRPEDAHLKYGAGLQFNDLNQESIASLTRFIELHLIERHTQVKVHEMSGLRCNVRFQVDRKETAVLNMAETYGVKKLSLGGLLIESGHAFEQDTRLHMGLSMPGDIHLEFVGRVASCLASPEEAGRFDVGMEFLDMSEQDNSRLKEFIRKLYLEDAGFKV